MNVSLKRHGFPLPFSKPRKQDYYPGDLKSQYQLALGFEDSLDPRSIILLHQNM
jgi:hypothetical protein